MNFRFLLITIFLILFSVSSFARGHGVGRSYSRGYSSKSYSSRSYSPRSSGITSVRSYTRRNGTYVKAHYRTSPDGTRTNNWSHRGNVNPYTGRRGYQN